MKETPKNQENKTKRKKGETLKEKVHRHLNDKNDMITEEDLRDVEVGVKAINLQEPDEPTLLAKDIPGNKKVVTPWDIVDEKE